MTAGIRPSDRKTDGPCLGVRPVSLPSDTPKTILTLSAVPELLPEDAEAATHIERELARIDGGADPDRLIAYVWGR